MLRVPAGGAQRRARTGVFQLPAPVLGLNARDNLMTMDPRYAVAMEDMFPEESYIRRRAAADSFAGGATGNFHSLFEYAKGSTSGSLVGFTTSGRMYAGITSGSLPAATSTTMGTAEATAVNVNSLLVVAFDNNTKVPQQWDGTTLSNVTITNGPSGGNAYLEHISLHKNRTYYCERNSLKFWFTATSAIGGDLTGKSFDLVYICKKGGYLQCTSTWTVDGGSGVDDLFVAVTSEGEVVVYQGSDPSDATAWSLVGVYEIPKPIGRRCTVKFGGDLLIITEVGIVSMAGLFAEGGIFRGRADFSSIIGPAWRSLVNLNTKTYPGWFGVHFPAMRMLVFNVPDTNSSYTGKQFIMNTATGAWCRWSVRMGCATIWQSRMIIGYTTSTYELEVNSAVASPPGKDDYASSTALTAYFKQAYSTLGVPGRKKLIRRIVPRMGDGDISVNYHVAMAADYQDAAYSSSNVRSVEWWGDRASASDFGTALLNPQESHGSLGTSFSLRFALDQGSTQIGQQNIIYAGADVHYEVGF